MARETLLFLGFVEFIGAGMGIGIQAMRACYLQRAERVPFTFRAQSLLPHELRSHDPDPTTKVMELHSPKIKFHSRLRVQHVRILFSIGLER